MITWLRTPTRPFSRRQPKIVPSCWLLPFLAGAAAALPLAFVAAAGLAAAFGEAAAPAFLRSAFSAVAFVPAVLALFLVFIAIAASSPALRLDVVDVGVLAALDVRHRPADVLAIFQDRVARLDVGEGDLVPDRHVMLRLEPEGRVRFGDQAQHVCTRLQTFNDHDPDRVLGAVDEAVRNAHCEVLIEGAPAATAPALSRPIAREVLYKI